MAETNRRPWHGVRDWFVSFAQAIDTREEDVVWHEINRLQKDNSVLREDKREGTAPRRHPAE